MQFRWCWCVAMVTLWVAMGTWWVAMVTLWVAIVTLWVAMVTLWVAMVTLWVAMVMITSWVIIPAEIRCFLHIQYIEVLVHKSGRRN